MFLKVHGRRRQLGNPILRFHYISKLERAPLAAGRSGLRYAPRNWEITNMKLDRNVHESSYIKLMSEEHLTSDLSKLRYVIKRVADAK
ncbi:unnamed protein product, partial [Iphiclides podalirius]